MSCIFMGKSASERITDLKKLQERGRSGRESRAESVELKMLRRMGR